MRSTRLITNGVIAVALVCLSLGSAARAHHVHTSWDTHHHHYSSGKKQKAYNKGYRKGYKHAIRSAATPWVRVFRPVYRPVYRPFYGPVHRLVVVSPHHSWLSVGIGANF